MEEKVMYDKFCVKKIIHGFGRGRIAFGTFLLIASVLLAGQAMAFNLDLFGKPLSVKGYINQSVQFGLAGDGYATIQGLQQVLMQGLLELEYYQTNNLKYFVSGSLTTDYAYNIFKSRDKWGTDQPPDSPVGRFFSQSRSEMGLRSDYEDVLSECHITWTPGDFNLRVGKQIVTWGRMDGFRIMDQINPVDGRLGFSDVEFETNIIPIWLAKLEYFPPVVPPFLYMLGFELTFNPNADFIPSKKPGTGGDVHGIWAASATAPAIPGFYPNGLRIMSFDSQIEEPDSWDSDGYEIGVRIKGTFPDSTYFTLNYFDGVNNDAVLRGRMGEGFSFAPGFLPGMGLEISDLVDDKWRNLSHPLMEGFYADQEFVGFTFAREFTEIVPKWAGGVSPMLRGEFTYEFDSTFTTNGLASPGQTATKENFVERDMIYWGLGVEWKIKVPWLNRRKNISIMPQFGMKHIKDYPDFDDATGRPVYLSGPLGSPVSENMYNIFVNVNTAYMNDKLRPSITWMRDIRSDVADQIDGSMKNNRWIFNLAYAPDYKWTYKIRCTLVSGDLDDVIDHYDNISFTVQYQF
jgi:hypothetical protein